MRTIARWTMAHRRLVLLAWIVGALGVFAVSQSVGSKSVNTFSLPGTGSQQATNLLQKKFPAQAGDTDQIVFKGRSGKLTNPADRTSITSTLDRVARLPHVSSVVSPYASPGQISRDGTIAFAMVRFDQTATALSKTAVNRVITTAQSARSATLQVELGGQAIENAQRTSPGSATMIGIAAAIVILLIAFGSALAMSLPLITAGLGLLAGLGLIALASHLINMANFASELALMIGLGVGVDYALFIVTRFRENYRTNGADVRQAVETALDTSGRAVLFAGATVVIALLGMFALGIDLLNGVAIAAAVGVLSVLAASLTLLPALLSMAGRRIGERGPRARRRLGNLARLMGRRASHPAARRRHRDDVAAQPRFWLGWVRHVQRHPALTATAATALMLALASPALSLRLGSSDAGNDPTSQTTRHAYDLLAQGFGPGFNGPLQIAVALPRSGDHAAVHQITHTLSATPGIASVAPARTSPNGTTAAIAAYPTTSPQSAQTATLVTHLRSNVLPPIERSTGAQAYVGGATATQVDFNHVLSSKLPLFIAVVVALGALLLLVVFRSLIIPVQAAFMNLLTIGASLGISQAVFERGWLGGLFGVQKGPIDAFIPVLTFAIVYGLSMDYQVFLVSRIHEEWEKRHDAAAAIREGVAHTGRVITAAAAIMVCVFGAFAISGQPTLAMFGLGLASAVLLDALVVRLLLVPAVLQLLGKTTWMLPRWLGRRLPRVALEAAPATQRRSSQPAPEAAA